MPIKETESYVIIKKENRLRVYIHVPSSQKNLQSSKRQKKTDTSAIADYYKTVEVEITLVGKVEQ